MEEERFSLLANRTVNKESVAFAELPAVSGSARLCFGVERFAWTATVRLSLCLLCGCLNPLGTERWNEEHSLRVYFEGRSAK